MTIRVMLADDNKVMQEGLKALLDDAPEIEVVGLASNGREDLERASELQPDVVVMDLNMPVMQSMIADGRNTKEIAFAFDCSVKTIEVHRMNSMKKLDLYSIAQLTRYALREGLTSI